MDGNKELTDVYVSGLSQWSDYLSDVQAVSAELSPLDLRLVNSGCGLGISALLALPVLFALPSLCKCLVLHTDG